MQTRATQESVFFDERSFQAVLTGANGACISCRAAADDGNVVDGFGQGLPLSFR